MLTSITAAALSISLAGAQSHPVLADTGTTPLPTDSLAFRLLETLRTHGAERPSGLFVLTMDDGARNPQMNIVFGNVTAQQKAALVPIAAEFLNRRGTTDGLSLSVRLERVEAPRTESFTEGLPEDVPRLRNRNQLGEALWAVSTAYPALVTPADTGMLKVLVNTSGEVAVAEVGHWSGAPEFETHLLSLADALRFTPGRIGGRAVPLWIYLPVRFRP